MTKKIVYIKGLWSHPKAVEWIKTNLENRTNLPVEIFDYHDLLIEKTSNETYLKKTLEKYGDYFGSRGDKIILIGHSLGGTISTIIAENFTVNSLVLTNPVIKPWGVFRRIPNHFKYLIGKTGITESYYPHFVVKYDEEIKERTAYFTNNFDIKRDISRVFYTGTEALKNLQNLKERLLLIQSMQDEFVSVSSNLKLYQRCNPKEKELILIPNGEHAILEEQEIYPQIYNHISRFIHK